MNDRIKLELYLISCYSYVLVQLADVRDVAETTPEVPEFHLDNPPLALPLADLQTPVIVERKQFRWDDQPVLTTWYQDSSPKRVDYPLIPPERVNSGDLYIHLNGDATRIWIRGILYDTPRWTVGSIGASHPTQMGRYLHINKRGEPRWLPASLPNDTEA